MVEDGIAKSFVYDVLQVCLRQSLTYSCVGLGWLAFVYHIIMSLLSINICMHIVNQFLSGLERGKKNALAFEW